MKHKIIFISWTPFGRHTELLGKSFGAKIFFFEKIIKSRGFLWKLLFPLDYLVKALKSFLIILETKPSIVFVQNPPSLAPIWVVALSKLFKFKTVIDSHNGAFENPWLRIPFHIWSLRNSTLITIHNQELYKSLVSDKNFHGINFKILNSRLSAFPGRLKNDLNEKYFLVISSFSSDEPMDILLEGIRNFCVDDTHNYKFKVTGNYKRRIEIFNKYSKENKIELLGFVEDSKYDYLLVNAFGIITLSTRDDVQQFALMEAVGAEVPFISTDNLTNQALFGNRMILTENNPVGISQSIMSFINRKKDLQKNILEIKKELNQKWKADFNHIKNELKI